MLVGAPRNLVSVDGENTVELAICERLVESGSGLCSMRTMIEDFSAQDDNVAVDTVWARLATMVKSELYKFSAVADQEKLNIIQACARLVCQGMRPEVESALHDIALMPAIDRFDLFVHGVEVKKPLRTHRLQAFLR